MELSDLIAYAVGVEQLNHLRWNFNDVLNFTKLFILIIIDMVSVLKALRLKSLYVRNCGHSSFLCILLYLAIARKSSKHLFCERL